MPSLHATWVVLLFLATWRKNWLTRIAFALLMVGTIVATLGTGEHYLLDLVVAVPFAVAMSLVAVETIGDRRTWLAFGRGMALTLAWICALRFAAPELEAIHWSVPLLSLITVLGAVGARWHWQIRVDGFLSSGTPRERVPSRLTHLRIGTPIDHQAPGRQDRVPEIGSRGRSVR